MFILVLLLLLGCVVNWVCDWKKCINYKMLDFSCEFGSRWIRIFIILLIELNIRL